MTISSPLPISLMPCPGVFPLTAARETALRTALMAEARSWIGTPYRQLGATKGVAVDCSMLLVRCLVNAGIVEDFDPRPYPPAWFLHQEDERYIDWLGVVGLEVTAPLAGDVVAFRIGRAFAHSGLISDPTHLIHAFADDGQVRESSLAIPALAFANRRDNTPRARRFYDLFARLRLNGPPSGESER